MPRTEAKFKALTISGVDFLKLGSEFGRSIIDAIIQAATDARWWYDEEGFRYSLLRCDEITASYVSGVITQQHRLEQHLYDDRKHESQNELDSYEDRFFVLDLKANLLILEWRQFRGKPPLSLPLMFRRMERILNAILADIAPGLAIQLLSIELETSKEEFVELFYGHRVLAIDVDSVGTYRVPKDVQLVNPNPHLEDALRDLLEHDFERNAIDRLVAEVQDDSGRDLRRAAIARGALHSGRPRMLTYQRETGQVLVRRETENGVIAVTVPTLETDSVDDRLHIAAAVLSAVHSLDLSQRPAIAPQPDQISIFDSLHDRIA